MNQSAHRSEKVFPAELASLEPARLFVIGCAEDLGLPPPRMFNLELALEEILVNVFNYAYTEKGTGNVTITCATSADTITVSIQDHGHPFDPLQKETPDLTCSIEDRQIGGLGIFLTREMVDEISYLRENDCNITTFTIRHS